MRIALGLEYCGTAYVGWQSQRDGRGVQDALERALASIAARPLATVAAGRTDAGVHATMQIVHFDADVDRPDTAWVRGVNAHLPPDVAVLWAQPVAGDVSCALRRRSHATTRTCSPTVRCGRRSSPGASAGTIGRSTSRRCARPRARCWAPTTSRRSARPNARRSRRRAALSEATIAASGDTLRFDFCANAFLHHMIRNIVGALVYVGAGRQPPAWIARAPRRPRPHARRADVRAGRALFHRRRLRRDVGAAADAPAGRAAACPDARHGSHARQDLRHHPARRRARRRGRRRRRDRLRVLAGHAARRGRGGGSAQSRRRCRPS